MIEGYPGAVQDILGMPRKQAGLENLRSALMDFGVKGGIKKKDITGDELDAITCAILGQDVPGRQLSGHRGRGRGLNDTPRRLPPPIPLGF